MDFTQDFLEELYSLSEDKMREEIYTLWKELGHLIMSDTRINPDTINVGMCSGCFEQGFAAMLCPKCDGDDVTTMVCENCYEKGRVCGICQGHKSVIGYRPVSW